MKTRIEEILPLAELNYSAISENLKKGHPGKLHLWWARSPIKSSAALLKAALEPVEDTKNQLSELVEIINGAGISSDAYVTVCDPFSGFGGLALAAQKLGLKVETSDLNSVAVLLTKAVAELPAKFKNHKPVNPSAKNKVYTNAQGLAADVLYYGNQLKKQVFQKLADYYPTVKYSSTSEKFKVYSWIWIRTMKCPNPTCGVQMPLASSYVLSKTKGNEYWAEPVFNNQHLEFHIHQGICPENCESNKYGNIGAKFICPVCGHITQENDVIIAGRSGKLKLELMAVCVLRDKKRFFIAANKEQLQAASVASLVEKPIGSIPHNARWFSPPRYGMTEYADLYTTRQLLLMTTFCQNISNEIVRVTEDAIKAGLSEDGQPLSNGGVGARAYGQLVGTYLGLVVSDMANYQSSICTWDNRHGNIRSAFTRQAIPMTWVFAEGNPFSTVTGNFNSILDNVVGAISNLEVHSEAKVSQQNALVAKFPKDSVLFTEPPYYDHVGYADLSDYFYVWLRQSVKDIFPSLFEKVVTSKEELTSIPEHYDSDSTKAVMKYQQGINQILANFWPSASRTYPSIIFFQYSTIDEDYLANRDVVSPLKQLLDSLNNNKYRITAIWPIRNTHAGKKFKSYRIAVVFRPKENNLPKTNRRSAINAVKWSLPGMLNQAYATGISEQDRFIVGLGLGLQVITKFGMIINADGSRMSIDNALQIVSQEVNNYLDALDTKESAKEKL